MHKDFAAPLTDLYPSAAQYDNNEVRLIGEMPKDFKGEIVRLYKDVSTTTGLLDAIYKLRNEVNTGKLVMLRKDQGRWLCKNHPAFMSTEDED